MRTYRSCDLLKVCTHCSVEKKNLDFGPRTYSSGTVTLQSWCRKCVNARAKLYNKTEVAKINRARYKHSVKGKRTSAAFERSEAGKASQRKYRSSLKGRRARSKIDNARRAKEADAEGELSLAEWDIIIDTHTDHRGTMCAYGYEIVDGPTVDHIEPISAGGRHEIDNIVPACRPCNASRGAKPLLRWMYDLAA